MINEGLQWAVLAVIAFLMLGLYRQLGVFLANAGTNAERVTGPPLRSQAPASLRLAVGQALPDRDGDVLVAFVSERCRGCSHLLASLEGQEVRDFLRRAGRDLLVVVKDPSPAFEDAVRSIGVAYVADDGRIWTECNVQFTPFLVHLDGRDTVLEKAVEHDIELAFA